MIRITEKSECCGCEACRNVCPRQCIVMKRDDEGFLYPEVAIAECIDCGLCKVVCPMRYPGEGRRPAAAFAARNTDDDVRLASSSGGIFTRLAEQVFDRGGVVFGARFDATWEVVHDYARSREELARFRGSKYVQSRIGDSFRQAEQFLKEGRLVLFSGTPCQIAGLRRFLRREYGNLLTVDVVCHGVPSPKVWQRYLEERASGDAGKITGISFRDKQHGWHEYRLSIKAGARELAPVDADRAIYSRLYLYELISRPSCHHCPVKGGRSGSDLTLGDFWGIEQVDPTFDDNKGCSAVLLNNPARKLLLDGIETRQVTYEQVLQGNPALECSPKPSINRGYLFHLLRKGYSVSEIHRRCFDRSPLRRILRHLYRIFNP